MTTADYNIGGIEITVNFLCPFLFPQKLCGSTYFKTRINKTKVWTINADSSCKIELNNYQTVFTGAQEFNEELPYKWSLLLSETNRKTIYFEFESHEDFHSGLAEIDEAEKTVELKLHTKHNAPILLDPFFHPFGILLLQYLIHSEKGYILHSSAVEMNNKGFLFAAVSGTGKSTMAKLWQQKGATIINDDRIIVKPTPKAITIYNTPMPYYFDQNKSIELSQFFILKQAPSNYIKPLKPLQGTLALLGNCIQYQFSESQVKERLDYIENTVQKKGVYEIGFKPDTSIVDLILKDFG